jgi:uncharacterized protein (TIGR02145 family)
MRKIISRSILILGFIIIGCHKQNNTSISTPTPLLTHTFGFTPTPPGVYATIQSAAAPPPVLGGALPGSFFLDVPTVPFDQGQEGSCVSCASAMAKSVLDHIQNKTSYTNNSIIYSPAYLFNQCTLDLADCSGSYVYSNLDILKGQGICNYADMPYSQLSCSPVPSSAQQTLAASHKIDHYFKIDPITTDWIKKFIYAGLPVIVAFQVDENFEGSTSTSVWNQFGMKYYGGHCAFLYGWDDSKNAFKLFNSWGANWGDGGTTWVDYDFVENGTSPTYGKIFSEAYIIQNPAATLQIPTVSTTDISSITSTSALSGGFVSDDGSGAITANGICWSTHTDPSITDSKTSDGITSPIFSSIMTGLIPGTTYYVKAYATNNAGTAYGAEDHFTTASNSTGTVTDVDGNTYNTIDIGTQTWFQQNLRVTKYADGSSIPYVTDPTTQASLTTGAYWNDDGGSGTYGRSYNWYTTTDTRGLCPNGWHIPTDNDWMILETSLGMTSAELSLYGVRGVAQNIGGNMKLTTIWQTPNTGATNSSGFSGIPFSITSDGNYFSVMWSATETATGGISRSLFSSTAGIDRENQYKYWGQQCRCVKN